MNNSKKHLGRYIGALIGAILALVLWLIPHASYSFVVALGISCIPLAFGYIGNCIQRKYSPE